MAQKKDEGLNGNEKIEQAVCQLQQEPTQEQLAHTLTVIRRRMRENGQVVVAVEPNPASEQMQLRALRTADGASWWYAFTSFEEEMKGAEAVQSTFLVEFEKLLDAALQVPEIQGIILNPWNRTIPPAAFWCAQTGPFYMVKKEGEWQIRLRRCGPS